ENRTFIMVNGGRPGCFLLLRNSCSTRVPLQLAPAERSTLLRYPRSKSLGSPKYISPTWSHTLPSPDRPPSLPAIAAIRYRPENSGSLPQPPSQTQTVSQGRCNTSKEPRSSP